MAEEKSKTRIEQIRERIKEFPACPGLYFMKGPKGKVLYIGKAKNLRSRVAGYFQPSANLVSSRGPRIAEMVEMVETVDYLETANEVDAVLKEARLIKDIRPPYNTDLVDDKTFPYLEITTGDDFPGVYITRKPREKGSRLFGPFVGSYDLRQTLVVLQKIFKFRTCKLDIRADDLNRKFFRPCILYSIKQCVAPCAALIDQKTYKKIISDLGKFLKSKRSVITHQWKQKMDEASAQTRYEEAAIYRDRIRLIERLDRRGTPDQDVQPEVFASDPAQALEQLQKLLKADEPIRIIEGIDVAHIAGSDAVGSLVKFIDGRPFRSGYRRFKIKTVEGIDDCAMISEVVRRRYKYALRGEELWPDLVLIDGGLGQLHAAEDALKELLATEDKEILSHREPFDFAQGRLRGHREFTQTRLAAIAKREEEIYLQGDAKPLKLSRTAPALKLLQYVRDEAHRFAQHYHHILRRRKFTNSD
jgi:excinuclease ABC subunit C